MPKDQHRRSTTEPSPTTLDPPPAAVPQNTSELRDSAPRRTYLAAERTYLAWLRTGLGAIGTALAVGRLLPALVGGSHRTYTLLGAGYGVLGIFLLTYALVRARRVRAALQSNAPLPLDSWALTVTTVIGLILAVATILMVLAVP